MKLSEIQKKLKAPKNQKNSFGGYNYRSCEDILEAVKPLLGDATVIISDEIVEVGGRIYVKATATFKGEDEASVTAYAREQEKKLNKEGKETMDHAQITGAASSYARKYALNGLFLIDDTKDADTMDNREATSSKKEQVEKVSRADQYEAMVQSLNTEKDMKAYWAKLPANDKKNPEVIRVFTKRKEDLQAEEVREAVTAAGI
jgi:hypothetical protein